MIKKLLLTSFLLREMKNEIPFFFSPIRLSKVKKFNDSTAGASVEKQAFPYMWVYKQVQPFWKTISQYLSE